MASVISGHGIFTRKKMLLKYTVNILKLGHPKNCSNYPKIGTVLFYYRVTGPKDADGMANTNVFLHSKHHDVFKINFLAETIEHVSVSVKETQGNKMRI